MLRATPGTYFEKEKWISLLNQLSTLYKEQPEKAIEYAEKLTEGIQNSELITLNSTEAVFTAVEIKKNVEDTQTLVGLLFKELNK